MAEQCQAKGSGNRGYRFLANPHFTHRTLPKGLYHIARAPWPPRLADRPPMRDQVEMQAVMQVDSANPHH